MCIKIVHFVVPSAHKSDGGSRALGDAVSLAAEVEGLGDAVENCPPNNWCNSCLNCKVCESCTPKCPEAALHAIGRQLCERAAQGATKLTPYLSTEWLPSVKFGAG